MLGDDSGRGTDDTGGGTDAGSVGKDGAFPDAAGDHPLTPDATDASGVADTADAGDGKTGPTDGTTGADAGEGGNGEDGGKGGDGKGDGVAGDGATDVVQADCPAPEPFDYGCDDKDPKGTCPDGICLAGLCIGPVLDPDRWKDCDDGTCGPCENAGTCPADCGSPPTLTGTKEYDNDTTISVWVHGFYNKSPDEMGGEIYGKEKGCSGVLELVPAFGVTRPCGDTPEGKTAPDQFTAVEYYGGVPADWLTPEDIEEIEQYPYSGGPLGLQRYGLVVAKFIRHKLDVSGATHVNLACHSMGCLLCRYVMENDVENLASENRIVRWYTSNGVLAGARLSRLFDNPSVQAGATALGLELADFILMNPDYVQDHACSWDHKLQEGNNPLFSGIIIHHSTATDPKIAEAFGIQLLDLNNPDDEPNDGIQYTFDEYFHSQHEDAAFVTPGGDVLPSSHTHSYFDHMTLPETDAAGILAAATLFHGRKVVVKLAQVALLNDREADNLFDSEHGAPPADISWIVNVRYNPYVASTFGKDVLVHEDRPEHRSAPLYQQQQGQVLLPGLTVFEGPVFDGMTSLDLELELLEMDMYPRFGINEWIWDPHQTLALYKGPVPLQDGAIAFESEFAKVKLEVRVYPLY
jgi:hypothetical protein